MDGPVLNPDQKPPSGGVLRRLVLGIGATSLGPIVTIGLQLVIIPVFLYFWGPEKYGEWLIVSAIPTYLGMSDLGFGTVAGNEMTMRAARGDFAGALRTFQSTWKLITLLSLSILAVVLPLLVFLPLDKFLRFKEISYTDARLTLIILAVDSLACLQTSLPTSALRSAGLNHVAYIGANAVRLTEGLCLMLAVARGFGPVTLALVLLVVRALGNLVLAVFSERRIAWLHYGFAQARMSTMRELFRPALAFMAFPASNAFNIQGSVLAVGLVLGPVYVSMFAPLRTVSRAVVWGTEIFKLSFWPELSLAYGARNFELARRLHRTACQLAVLVSAALELFLAVFGYRILSAWTHGKVPIDMPTFYLLLVGVTATSLWNTSSAVLIAANLHTRIAVEQLASTVAALALSVLLMRPLGLKGSALALLGAEVFMLIVVVPAANRLLHDHAGPFFAALFDVRSLAGIVRRRFRARVA